MQFREWMDVSSDPPSDRGEPHPLPPVPGLRLQPGFSLRRGQALFLGKLAEAFGRGEPNHLGVFVPGYGKTITALASFVVAYRLGLARRLVVFVPRGNLRDQYADPEELRRVLRSLGAPPFTFCVADSERVFLKNLHTHIIITTYQYASGRGGHRALLEFCRSAPCLFVFDEVHHLSEDGLWAAKIGAFPHAGSVALSGTPMRSDNRTLFGVPMETREDGEQFYRALHEVTMRDAHEEGRILKRVRAHIVDYHLKMVREDTGQEVELSLSQIADVARTQKEVDAYLARRKLRFHEVYLETLLAPAFARFQEKRAALREAAGRAGVPLRRSHQMLVIAMSNRHAAAMLDFVRRRFPHFTSARIGQDVPAQEREALLDGFREGEIDVMVQVDMIGEGTDIKPISVIVKADLVRALSKTMQQVFRGMRYFDGFPGEANVCDIYAANDSAVVHTLEWITREEQIGVRLREAREREAAAARGGETHSVWELKAVEQQLMRTHSLELGGEAARLTSHTVRPAEPEAVDVRTQEKLLRQECAALASELANVLRAGGRAGDVREVHAAAKRQFSKSQGELSIPELTRKRAWLERCLRAGRLL